MTNANDILNMVNIDKTTEILFKDEEGKSFWENAMKEAKEDIGCMYVVRYASYWAKCMQKRMEEEGKRVEEIAEQVSSQCDVLDGISVTTYITAVFLLARSWKYGKELLRWHNKKYGYNGDDTIITPNRLSVGKRV